MDSPQRPEYGEVTFDKVSEDYHASVPKLPQAFVEFIVHQYSLQAGSWVIELGCGSGGLARSLAQLGIRITGVDCSRALLGIAQKIDRTQEVEWIESYAEDYYPDCTLRRPDLLFVYEAFHLFFDKQRVITNATKYLRPNGIIAVGWCDYHWELILRDIVVRVFARYGINWGEWGYQECPDFIKVIEAYVESFTTCYTSAIWVEECASLSSVARFLTSIDKAAKLDSEIRNELRNELHAEFVRKIGKEELQGRSTYWMRSALRCGP